MQDNEGVSGCLVADLSDLFGGMRGSILLGAYSLTLFR